MRMSYESLVASLHLLLLATVAAQDTCTLKTTFKDDDFPCRKLLHCQEPSDWTSLSTEIKTKSYVDRLCAIVVDCANTASISNIDFQAIGGVFDRVVNITILRCNTTRVRLAADMNYVFEVDLKGNAFDSLGFMQDWRKADLVTLHLPHNQIKHIRKTCLFGMIDLSKLILHSNLIKDVEPGCFQDKQKLHTVDLANNCIETLGENMFRNLKELTTVRLAGNRINSMDTAVFVNVHLESLDLSHNDITTVPNSAFVNISVIFLNLSNCRIVNIPFGFLSGLQQDLTKLDLSNNDIDSLPANAFVHLSDLQVIYLSGNRITTIEQSMFPLKILLTFKDFRRCHLLYLQTVTKGTSNDDI
ncbi:hypothetical protein LSAT2_031492, partial [Lamellibrachia satsuma]